MALLGPAERSLTPDTRQPFLLFFSRWHTYASIASIPVEINRLVSKVFFKHDVEGLVYHSEIPDVILPS
jgi:hypothetical protein